jgi:hypothetical protein
MYLSLADDLILWYIDIWEVVDVWNSRIDRSAKEAKTFT